MTAPGPCYDIGALTVFTTAVLDRAGVRPDDAAITADVLIGAV